MVTAFLSRKFSRLLSHHLPSFPLFSPPSPTFSLSLLFLSLLSLSFSPCLSFLSFFSLPLHSSTVRCSTSVYVPSLFVAHKYAHTRRDYTRYCCGDTLATCCSLYLSLLSMSLSLPLFLSLSPLHNSRSVYISSQLPTTTRTHGEIYTRYCCSTAACVFVLPVSTQEQSYQHLPPYAPLFIVQIPLGSHVGTRCVSHTRHPL